MMFGGSLFLLLIAGRSVIRVGFRLPPSVGYQSEDCCKCYKIHTALAQDSTQGVAVAAKSIHQRATSIRTTDPKVQKLLTQITIASRDFQTSSLDNARDSFFELSKPLLVYVNQFHAQRQCANGSDPLNSRHRAVMSPMFMH